MEIDRQTIVRTAVLVISWVNMVLSHYELQPFPVLGEQEVALVFAALSSIWAWFKNNYITLRGRQQKEILKKHHLIR